MFATWFETLHDIAALYHRFNRDMLSELFHELFQIHCDWDWAKINAAEYRMAATGVWEDNEFVEYFWIEPIRTAS